MTLGRRPAPTNSAGRIPLPTIAVRARAAPLFSPAARHREHCSVPAPAESREASSPTGPTPADLAAAAEAARPAPAVDQSFPSSAAACRPAHVLPTPPVRFDGLAIGA